MENTDKNDFNATVGNAMLSAVAFEKWFKNNLLVTRYPTLKDLKTRFNMYERIINVSDEYIDSYFQTIKNKKYHWFPMGEMSKDMGLSSIFGALQILYNAYQNNEMVLLHCHAGANRSVVIKECLHYMFTGKLYEKEYNRLIANSAFPKKQHLPDFEKMEKWLKSCREAFENPEKFIGGMYDWTLREAGLA